MLRKYEDISARLADMFRQLRITGFLHPGGGLTVGRNISQADRADILKQLIAECLQEEQRQLQQEQAGTFDEAWDDADEGEVRNFATRVPGQTGADTVPVRPTRLSVGVQVARFAADREIHGGAWWRAGLWKKGEPETLPGRPREYWDAIAGDCPIIARVAEQRLSAVNGSSEAERAFSQLRWALGQLKTNIGDETVNSLMLIAHNAELAARLAGWRPMRDPSEKGKHRFAFT